MYAIRSYYVLQRSQGGADGVDLVAQIEADIQGHLIVARAGGVQLATDRADLLDQTRLDIHVNIFAGNA